MESKRPRGATVPGGTGGAFLDAKPLRAASEAWALAVAFALPFLVVGSGPRPGDPTFGLVVGPLCAMLFAARARLRSGGRLANALREAAAGAPAVAPAAALGALLSSAGAARQPTVSAAAYLLVWGLGALAFFRVLAYLWPLWAALRRRRLRWEMTHATLAVVATLSSVAILASVLATLLAGGFPPEGAADPSFSRRLPSALLVLGLAVFLTVVALAFVLPPAAVASYFAARRTARRLEALARCAGGLRGGNLAARVPVDGEDELSDLQRDFNSMAEDLEGAVRDLRAERDNVRRLLEAQRELLASVSHELRTPVATVRGHLESALDGRAGNASEPAELRGDLEVMSREVIRLQRLIDDLFALSRAEVGRLPFEIRPVDVAALLRRCAEAVVWDAWRRGKVEVICEVRSDLPRAVADEGRLEQAVRNLLQNAVRHTAPGGVVALAAIPEQDAVVVEVKDTGEGIPPEDLDRVFERFWRSEGARRLDGSGAGLGLALVKELVEAMGGTVSVESETGTGSRFVLRLPRDPRPDAG